MVTMSNTDDRKHESPPIVTHVTQVTISLQPDAVTASEQDASSVTPEMVKKCGQRIADHYQRVASMMEVLAGLGFTFRSSDNAVHCFSSRVEAGEVKRRLLAAGFKDREFQIVLEYTRGWGML